MVSGEGEENWGMLGWWNLGYRGEVEVADVGSVEVRDVADKRFRALILWHQEGVRGAGLWLPFCFWTSWNFFQGSLGNSNSNLKSL